MDSENGTGQETQRYPEQQVRDYQEEIRIDGLLREGILKKHRHLASIDGWGTDQEAEKRSIEAYIRDVCWKERTKEGDNRTYKIVYVSNIRRSDYRKM
mmetsp:Transcript_35004/g.34688  ORF Transcript_35004/g.34688 Transcript_35004/m.34688 type:complete len:98 (+) Transcript_35004:1-294(+)